MKTALIPVAAKFLDDEVIYPYYRLQEAGFKVEVYCAQPSQWKYGLCCYGKYGVPIPVTIMDLEKTFSPYQETTALVGTTLQKFVTNEVLPDLILIPGGVESTEVLRQDAALQKLIIRQNFADRLIAAYCHGPQVLISTCVTKNRKMTCYKGMMVDLKNSGAEVPDESVRVVVDNNFVTAQHYRDNPEFLAKVIETYRLRNEVIH